MPKPIRPMFRAKTRLNASQETTLELLVYDEIGEDFWTGAGVTAKSVAAAIQRAGSFDRISVRVNSPGGQAFEGVAIYNLLRAQGKPIDVFVDGMAASAASVIAMAGDTVTVGVGAMIMIHNAAWGIFGDARVLRKAADDIEKISVTVAEIYVRKTGQSADEIKALMDAETWMGAQEAIDGKFADKLIDQDGESKARADALAKTFNLRCYKNVPESLKGTKNAGGQCDCGCEPCMDGDCAECDNANCDDPNCIGCPAQQEIGSRAGDTSDEIARQRLALYERG